MDREPRCRAIFSLLPNIDDSELSGVSRLNPRKYGKKFTVQVRAYDKAGNLRSSGRRTYRRP